jgi:integrase
MPAYHFTKSIIDDLKITPKAYECKDCKIPGLRLRVYPSGSKTFLLYRKIQGQPQRIKLGRWGELSLEQVRKEAIRLNALIALGGNPASEKIIAKKELHVKDLCLLYYEEYAIIYNKRPEDNYKALQRHIIPAIGKMKLSDVSMSRVRTLHYDIGMARGKYSANRVIAILNAVFNFGIKNGFYGGQNPCFGVRKFRGTSRDRFLSKAELKKFFEALKPEESIYKDYFSLLLYTGARKSNVLAMKWADIDFDLKQWRIDGEETKNQSVNIVYLSEDSLEILRRREEENSQSEIPSAFVFPGTGVKGYLQDPKKAFMRIRKRMGVADFRIHDLRRTMASYMAISGSSLLVIGAALNHKSQASTAIYARLAQAPVLGAMNTAIEAMKS